MREADSAGETLVPRGCSGSSSFYRSHEGRRGPDDNVAGSDWAPGLTEKERKEPAASQRIQHSEPIQD